MHTTSQEILTKSKSNLDSSASSLYSEETVSTVRSSETLDNEPNCSSHFLGAISNKIRSRSRDRSTTPTPLHTTSKSASESPRHLVTPTPKMNQHANTMPAAMRTMSAGSSETAVSRVSFVDTKPNKRTSTDRSDFERMSYGRHSGDWLFGGFSVKDTVKKAVGKKKSGSG